MSASEAWIRAHCDFDKMECISPDGAKWYMEIIHGVGYVTRIDEKGTHYTQTFGEMGIAYKAYQDWLDNKIEKELLE